MIFRSLMCSLNPTPAQADKLLRLMETFNAACDFASEVAWREKTFNSVKLHHLVYYDIRKQFGLPAQLTAQAIRKVADAYKQDKNTKRSFNPHGAVAYNDRILRLIGVTYVSMNLPGGREKIKLSVGGYHAKRLKGAVLGETELCYQKDKKRFRLHFQIKGEEPEGIDPDGFLGIDLGVVNLAVSSDGEVFSSSELKAIRHRHRRLRTKLQAKGTKSAKRLLVKRSKKEQRFAKHTNHVVSKKIVGIAKGTNRGIALENLKGIRDGKRLRRNQKPAFHSWSFYQLQEFIAYKAQAAGVAVLKVDPRNTSRTCPSCGCIDKRNRPNQATFSCVSCEFSGLADLVAAGNIARRAEVTRKAAIHLASSEAGINAYPI